jgi:anaerobic magnesium-protoporphyrin IX monomethyl ester cyclase
LNLLLANIYFDHGADESHDNMKHLTFPLGLGIIAGEIMKNRPSDNMVIVDNYISPLAESEIFKLVESEKIDCILLSMYLGNYQYKPLKNFINRIGKFFPQVKVIVGGALASTIPLLLLKNCEECSNLICVISEGEETIIELLSSLAEKEEIDKVRGIIYKRGNTVKRTGQRHRIRDLDRRARPAYELFDMKKYVEYIRESNRCWEISASRGCYGNCVYCKLVFGRLVTMRSTDSIVREMEDIYFRYGIDRFNFVDDNFLNSDSQVYRFYESLKRSRVPFRWRFQGRADRFHIELANKLAEVGLYDVSFGIESGSQEILVEMNKKMNLDAALKNITALPDSIDTHGSFIIGMPGESSSSIDATMEFINRSGLKNANAAILTPFPGTAIYDHAARIGKIENDDRYCEELGPVYAKPYVNMTKYPDDMLLEWVSSINALTRQ